VSRLKEGRKSEAEDYDRRREQLILQNDQLRKKLRDRQYELDSLNS
jgi:hypothetical protein